MIRFLHKLFARCCKKSTERPFVTTRQTLLTSMCVSAAIFLLCSSTALGQLVETFDRPRQHFSLWRDDCRAVVNRPLNSTPGVETLDVHFSHGSFVYLSYPVEPCAVVDDLTASMRVLCAHSGMKIGFRVVFPKSANAVTNNPLSVVIFGSPTQQNGQWSSTSVSRILKPLQEKQVLLRAEYGPRVDLSAPYIDAIILDVYQFPGTTRLQLDDLTLEGIVPYSAQAIPLQDDAPTTQPVTVAERLQILQTSVPRWIQYHNEELDYLQSLGFNGVVAPSIENDLMLEQAALNGMAVIAPPPAYIPVESDARKLAPLKAWMLGWEMNESQLENTRNQVAQLSRYPQSLARPTIGEAMERYGAFSRLTDWLAIPTPLATRVRSLDESDEIQRSESRALTGLSTPLTSIVTQMSREWMEQKAVVQTLLGGDSVGIPDYDHLQNRLAIYRSIMQGTRGWIFRSSGPLDRGDPTTMARARGYTALNQELELLSPWIQANQNTWRPVTTNNTQYRAASLSTTNSQLVIIVASGPMDQICAVSPEASSIQITLANPGQVRYVFRITHGTMEQLRTEPRTDGLYVTIENPALIEQLVTVVDPRPIEYLRSQLERRSQALMISRIETSQQILQLAQMAFVAQQLPRSHPYWEAINRAQTFTREAQHARSRNNIQGCLRSADESIKIAQRVLRASWEEAISQFSNFQSSPLVASPLALPLHWELMRLLRRDRVWQVTPIPGIPSSSWEQMQQLGWRVDQRLTDQIHTYVDVQPAPHSALSAAVSNGSGLGLTTNTTSGGSLVVASATANSQPVPTGYAGAAMRISSPFIVAPVGSLVHIQGSVQIQSPTNEPQSGLLISDSQGGESLGELISSADPSNEPWRQFGLFRMVTNPAGFQIYFETRGAMQATIRDLRVEMIVPATAPGLPIRRLEPNEVPADFVPPSESMGEVIFESPLPPSGTESQTVPLPAPPNRFTPQSVPQTQSFPQLPNLNPAVLSQPMQNSTQQNTTPMAYPQSGR